jgi:superfamily II DNA or RNA helicase
MNNNYINLQINGKLFPSWILLNFKKYQLPEYIQKEGEDPCKMSKTKKELRKYQEFLSKFLDYRSPFKDILVYHGLGSGKTVTAINIYNILYNYNPDWNIFLLIKASLKKDPWEKDLEMWLESNDKKNRFANIKFIHYDSPYADRDFLNKIKMADSSKNNIYIIDETHNFIKNVYNNISSSNGQRAFFIYNYIKKQKQEDKSTRIVLLSGTPAVNNSFELVLIFNLLRPNSFPDKETIFNDIFIKDNKINPEKKNLFQRRILGLVSYYAGATKDLFASKKINFEDIIMTEYQKDIYTYYDDIEKKIEKQSYKGSSTYKSFTRQSSNFVFPNISNKINGESRPRPSKFNVSEKLANLILEDKLSQKNIDKNKNNNIIEYNDLLNYYVKNFKLYLEKIKSKDTKSLSDDIKVYIEKYNYNFNKFIKEYNNKSLLLIKLYECSCKMTAIIFKTLESNGPILVYSNYVKMEGLDIFKIYLEFFGYADYSSSKKTKYYYTEYHGGITNVEQREKNRRIFNDVKNIKGDIIKIILISPAGSEGISLSNVRQVHILEPYWNEIRIQQLIGRAIRQCSHKDLPIKDRHVDIFRYKAIINNNELTTDQKIENLALKKNNLINTFLLLIKQAAVDCQLFKNVNMIEEKYQCFKFDDNYLFNKNVGPAYKEDLDIDMELDNGLNSSNYIVKSIKVREIYAVVKIDDDKYSDKQLYLLDEKTNIVYDYDLNFALGKLLMSEYDIPNKLDKETFIIDEVINIPRLKIN